MSWANCSTLASRHPVQLAALQALGQVNDPAVGRLVVAHWKAMSPGVRREAAELLFSRRDRLEHLLGALESRTLAAAEIDPDRLKQLRTHKDAQLRARAIRIIDDASLAARDQKATFAAFQVAATTSRTARQGSCRFSQDLCHLPSRPRRGCRCRARSGHGRRAISGRPALAHSGSQSRGRTQLRQLQCGDDRRPDDLGDHRLRVGHRADAQARRSGDRGSPPAQIEAIASTGQSLMPEGLEKGQTPQDLADLIAFVKSIQQSSASPGPQPGR